jgi:hypothetical protein
VYEIVSRQEPHSGKDPLNVSKEIKEKGLTPEIPSDCPQKLRELMEMCWKKEPSKRPVSFLFYSLFSHFTLRYLFSFIHTHTYNIFCCFVFST